MRVYRYEKDLTGVNGKSFGEVSESNSRYFAKTFKGAIMWGFLFNTLHPEVKIYDGYIVEYEINGAFLKLLQFLLHLLFPTYHKEQN